MEAATFDPMLSLDGRRCRERLQLRGLYITTTTTTDTTVAVEQSARMLGCRAACSLCPGGKQASCQL